MSEFPSCMWLYMSDMLVLLVLLDNMSQHAACAQGEQSFCPTHPPNSISVGSPIEQKKRGGSRDVPHSLCYPFKCTVLESGVT